MFRKELPRHIVAEVTLTDLRGCKTIGHRAKAHEQIKPVRQNKHHVYLLRWFVNDYVSSYPNLVTLKGLMTLETKMPFSVAPLLRAPQGT